MCTVRNPVHKSTADVSRHLVMFNPPMLSVLAPLSQGLPDSELDIVLDKCQVSASCHILFVYLPRLLLETGEVPSDQNKRIGDLCPLLEFGDALPSPFNLGFPLTIFVFTKHGIGLQHLMFGGQRLRPNFFFCSTLRWKRQSCVNLGFGSRPPSCEAGHRGTQAVEFLAYGRTGKEELDARGPWHGFWSRMGGTKNIAPSKSLTLLLAYLKEDTPTWMVAVGLFVSLLVCFCCVCFLVCLFVCLFVCSFCFDLWLVLLLLVVFVCTFVCLVVVGLLVS